MSDEPVFEMSDDLKKRFEHFSTGSPEVDDFSYILLKKDGEEIRIDDSNKRDYVLDLYEKAMARMQEEDPENFERKEMSDEDIQKVPINILLSSMDADGQDVEMQFEQKSYMESCKEFHNETKKARAQLRDELFAFHGLSEDDEDADLLWEEAFQVAPGKFDTIAEAFGKMLADTEHERGDFETPMVEEEPDGEEVDEEAKEAS